MFAYSTHARAIHWENPISLSLFDATNHPNSSRANIHAAFAYLQGALGTDDEAMKIEFSQKADELFLRAIALDKTGLSSTIGRIVAMQIIKKPVAKNYLLDLKQKLATRKLDMSTQSALSTLKNCQRDRICTLNNEDVSSLLISAISNPSVNDNLRASYYIFLADHYIAAENDLKKAEELIKEAIKLNSDELHYRLDLVNIYIGTRQFNLAKSELNTLKSLDRFKMLNHTIKNWETHLNKQIANSSEQF